jgi:hypothetical protein
VHGFRNASENEVTYLNIHAPGSGFADYMRSIRDGDPISYDQFDPPQDGGQDPSNARIGARDSRETGAGVRVDLLTEEGISVAEVAAEPGASSDDMNRIDGRWQFAWVLEGSLGVGASAHASPGTWVGWEGLEPHWSTAGSCGAKLLLIGF